MEEIKVSQEEYKKARSPKILSSGGLGPCIVVGAIYKNCGYMCHAVPDVIDRFLDKMLADLKRDVTNKRKLKIYLAGGGFNSDHDEAYREDVFAGREKALELIVLAGFRGQIKEVRWNKKNHSQVLTLSLEDGKVEYNEEIAEDSPFYDGDF